MKDSMSATGMARMLHVLTGKHVLVLVVEVETDNAMSVDLASTVQKDATEEILRFALETSQAQPQQEIA